MPWGSRMRKRVVEAGPPYGAGGADRLGPGLAELLVVLALEVRGREKQRRVRPATRRLGLPYALSMCDSHDRTPLTLKCNVVLPPPANKRKSSGSHLADQHFPVWRAGQVRVRGAGVGVTVANLTVRLSLTSSPVAFGRHVDPAAFTPPARVTIVAGKGGVGKTTVTAALAGLAARAGLTTLVVEVEGKSGLGALFGRPEPLTYREEVLQPAGAAGPGSGEVRARTLTPDDALVDYLDSHGLRRVSKRLTSTGTLDVVATAVPGIKDILVLGKVKQLEVQSATGQEGAADFIVVDAPGGRARGDVPGQRLRAGRCGRGRPHPDPGPRRGGLAR